MAFRKHKSKTDADSAATAAFREERRSSELSAFENSIVGFFTDTADLLGVPRSVAIIYGTLFATPLPMSFAEIESRLNLSKGSISQGLRLLKGMGAIKEVSLPSDRVELFTPDMEMRRLIQRFIEQRLRQQLEAGRTRLSEIKKTLPPLSEAESETLLGRLNQLQAWHDKTRALLPLAQTFLKLT